MLQTLRTSSRLLAKRWLPLAEELKSLDAKLDELTSQNAKRLHGPQTAAVMVAVAGDKPERLKSKAALAAICGASRLHVYLAKRAGIV
jgi:transposase